MRCVGGLRGAVCKCFRAMLLSSLAFLSDIIGSLKTILRAGRVIGEWGLGSQWVRCGVKKWGGAGERSGLANGEGRSGVARAGAKERSGVQWGDAMRRMA